jgi:cbb3-type cytochrome oxidase subunit 3
MSLLFTMWTVLVAVVFLGIVIWVFLENKEEFDAAAQIPFEETDEPLVEADSKEESRG